MESRSAIGGGEKGGPFVQNLFVMRHGERLDNYDPYWIRTAARPWDPPLTENGKFHAWETSRRLRAEGWNITRVFCSPFIRCVQTTAEVVAALCVVGDHARVISSAGVVIDPSKVKVSIEYGLCEVMNYVAIRDPPSEESNWILDHSELEAILPAGTVDHFVERILLQLPQWGESTEADVDEIRQTAAAKHGKRSFDSMRYGFLKCHCCRECPRWKYGSCMLAV